MEAGINDHCRKRAPRNLLARRVGLVGLEVEEHGHEGDVRLALELDGD